MKFQIHSYILGNGKQSLESHKIKIVKPLTTNATQTYQYERSRKIPEKPRTDKYSEMEMTDFNQSFFLDFR